MHWSPGRRPQRARPLLLPPHTEGMLMKRVGLLLAVLLVLVIGCARQDKAKLIVGKWQEVGGKQRGEFFADGNVIFLGRLQGKWRFNENGQLAIEATVLGYHVNPTFNVSFDHDILTLTDADENVQTYQRVVDSAPGPSEKKANSPTK
jgi:hypothetical protein